MKNTQDAVWNFFSRPFFMSSSPCLRTSASKKRHLGVQEAVSCMARSSILASKKQCFVRHDFQRFTAAFRTWHHVFLKNICGRIIISMIILLPLHSE